MAINGDLDVRAEVALDSWNPANRVSLVSKSGPTWPTDLSYGFGVEPGGELSLTWSADGRTPLVAVSTSPTLGATDSSRWVRATLDVVTSAGTSAVRFYTSSDGSQWSQLGLPVSLPSATKVYNGPGRVSLGSLQGRDEFLSGYLLKVEVRNGVDGPAVLGFNALNVEPPENTHEDPTGATWTVNGSNWSLTNIGQSLPLQSCNTGTVRREDDGRRYFDPQASWNRPAAELGAATGRLASYADRFWLHAGEPAPSGVVNVNFDDYSVPVYDLRDANTTIRAFQQTSYQGISAFSPGGGANLPVSVGATIPWNWCWAPGAGEDRNMIVVDPDTGETWEFYGADLPLGALRENQCADGGVPPLIPSGPNTSAGFDQRNRAHKCFYAINRYRNLFSARDGQSPSSLVNSRGMGINKAALVVRASEVKSGSIDHALSVTISSTMFGVPACSQAEGLTDPGAGSTCGVYVAPATRIEHAADPTNRCGPERAAANRPTTANRERTVPEGLRIALRMTDTEIESWLNSRGYSGAVRSTARAFVEALRTYGGIVSETGCYGIGIETDGVGDITEGGSRDIWKELGITDQTGDGTPFGDLLAGLFTRDRIYVVNTPGA